MKIDKITQKFIVMEIANFYFTAINAVAAKTCNLLGHSWRYKDYSNFMKANGEKYDFTIARHCTRCQKRSYFNGKWVDGNKNKLDFINDALSVRYY
jgi:hypothetical protein